jgi:alkaline phosphatase D
MLGERQLAWLKAGLAASKATFKLVVCGNQMLSECPSGESWGNLFRPERDAFLDWLWAEGIAGVIFLAGDRHFAELVRKSDPQKRGPDLWELTSSPLANFHFAAADTIPNPDRQACYAGGVNVGILRFDTTASPPRVEMLVLDGGGKVVIRQELTVRRR